MGRAEPGSTKAIANKSKMVGLQRLRWWCEPCQKQCRDENGFKQHTLSESHNRNMQIVGEDSRGYINEKSRQFQRDFIRLLRTGHGEKKISLNQFYNEYIKDKEHVHMNSTKWPSLTEFAKHLGREGICRVEEGDRGLEVAWIDDSSEAIRRKEDIKKKDRLAKGDEDIESRLLEQQIKRAREEAEKKDAERKRKAEEEKAQRGHQEEPQVIEPVKVSLSLKGAKIPEKKKKKEANEQPLEGVPVAIETFSAADAAAPEAKIEPESKAVVDEKAMEAEKPDAPPKMSLSLAAKKKNANPLARKNPFAKKTDVVRAEPEKKMSNAERIMKEELERKRSAEERGYGGKRQRIN
ncbi:Putative KIN17-like protein [Septoria linicola]|uniref:KIN17-like protein n=1 Tax=Septoria linicola TaxID=215465 RepID=A0A9Q9EGY1_9PEZI|nr:putative KIN17-like protein [Septoria linicola]USW51241.1 Putative KIN17-like protein [Septoria linicola]